MMTIKATVCILGLISLLTIVAFFEVHPKLLDVAMLITIVSCSIWTTIQLVTY